MKKLLLLGALISSVAMAEGIAEVRAGLDFAGSSFNYGLDLSNKIKSGFELSGEYRQGEKEGLQYGGGIAYRYSKLPKIAGYDSKGFHSVPLYFTTRYNFATGSDVVPYVKANLGYAFSSGSIKRTWDGVNALGIRSHGKDEVKFGSGFYYGLGTGIQYKNFVVDLTWSNTLVKTKWDYESNYGSIAKEEYSGSRNLNHNIVTLSFGYSFGL